MLQDAVDNVRDYVVADMPHETTSNGEGHAGIEYLTRPALGAQPQSSPWIRDISPCRPGNHA